MLRLVFAGGPSDHVHEAKRQQSRICVVASADYCDIVLQVDTTWPPGHAIRSFVLTHGMCTRLNWAPSVV